MIYTYIDEEFSRGQYDDYIAKVRSIVESFGGEYILRTENATALSERKNPQRVIVISFPNRDSLNACFSSEEYKSIEHERTASVDARAVIADG